MLPVHQRPKRNFLFSYYSVLRLCSLTTRAASGIFRGGSSNFRGCPYPGFPAFGMESAPKMTCWQCQ